MSDEMVAALNEVARRIQRGEIAGEITETHSWGFRIESETRIVIELLAEFGGEKCQVMGERTIARRGMENAPQQIGPFAPTPDLD